MLYPEGVRKKLKNLLIFKEECITLCSLSGIQIQVVSIIF
nr:MAG TPA: hypothetical protein [Caudoviricetes sp.]